MYRLKSIADRIDAVNERVGHGLAWMSLVVVIVAASVALLRYVLGVGWVWMQDFYLWVNGAMFMLGAGYTLLHDKHVRVDFFYVTRSDRFRAGIDVFGVLAFLLPTVLVVAWLSYPYVANSWSRFEGSVQAGGLPGVFLLKSVLVLFCIPLAAQGASMAIRSLLVLAGHDDGTPKRRHD